MSYEAILQRDAEALRLEEEEEEEERARLAAVPPPQQTPEEAILAAYQAAFGWAGPAPVFIDLTDDGSVDGKGKSKDDDVYGSVPGGSRRAQTFFNVLFNV